MTLSLTFDFAQVEWQFVFVSVALSLATLSSVFVLKALKFDKWQVRKFGHMLIHFLIAFIPYLFSHMISIIIALVIIGIIVVIISLIPPINFLQRLYFECTREGEKVRELVLNTIATAFALLLILFVFVDKLHIFTAAVLTVSLGDGMGEIIGRPYGRIRYKIFSEKSLEGSIFVFIGTFLSILVSFAYHSLLSLEGFWWKALVLGLIGMVVEAFNFKFLDNTALPLSIAFGLFLLFEMQ